MNNKKPFLSFSVKQKIRKTSIVLLVLFWLPIYLAGMYNDKIYSSLSTVLSIYLMHIWIGFPILLLIAWLVFAYKAYQSPRLSEKFGWLYFIDHHFYKDLASFLGFNVKADYLFGASSYTSIFFAPFLPDSFISWFKRPATLELIWHLLNILLVLACMESAVFLRPHTNNIEEEDKK